MNKLLPVVCILSLMVLFACKVSDVKKPLEGKWEAIESQSNYAEKYLSGGIEFFHDGTVVMSDFPDKRLPYKTELTAAENELIKKNYPELQGKNVVLILLDPSQMDWSQNAAVYQYVIKGDELSLRAVIEEQPTTYRRKTSGRRQ